MEKAELTALVVKAQSGDQTAMEEVLCTAHTSVSYQCRKLLRDPRDAEDMTQEVLLAVYTKLDSLKTPEAFWGWLNQTTANRCYNAMKRGHVEFQFAEDDEGHSFLDDLEELDEQQVPDKALDNSETTRMIEEIVDGLPDAQRLCTLMYYYDEMSVKDIAETLGVPENTVKSRLNYARKAVKERVLDYEKKGVKLYGLSPLPFMLFFLLRATSESADTAKAAAVARQVMEMGAAAAAGAGGTAAAVGAAEAAGTAAGGSAAVAGGTSAAAGTAAAGGSAAAGTVLTHVAGGLSTKVIAGALAGLLLAGGAGAAVVAATQNAEEPEPVISEVVPEETEAVPEPTEEAAEETETPPVEDELIPADRLALLNDVVYYGDLAQCNMTVNQARAYAEAIETRTVELVSDEHGAAVCYAVLGDIGEGNPVLILACGSDGGQTVPDSDEHSFYGKLEVWRYADGQAEMIAAAHQMYWKAGEGFVCHTREDDPAFFSVDAYSVEGGVLSASPIASARVEGAVDPPFGIDGQPTTGYECDWDAWRALWDEGGQKSIRTLNDRPGVSLYFNWSIGYYEAGWTIISTGSELSSGDADEGWLRTSEYSLGSDTADVLRQCAGE